MLGRILPRKRHDGGIAHRLYGAIVTQARSPAFYLDFGVADAVEGRFDMIILHAFLLFERLQALGPEGSRLSQEVFDLFFKDMDRSLREMGVGDMAVPKRVKSMAQGFFGRAAVYRQASADGDHAAMAAAIARNIFPDGGPPASSAALADYAFAALALLKQQAAADLLAGNVAFPDPAGFRPEAAP